MDAIDCFWFRRDMRLEDNVGLFEALQAGGPVLPVFIFDKAILDPLPARDARLVFIHLTLQSLQKQLRSQGSDLYTVHAHPLQAWRHLLAQYPIRHVYTNHDFEPYAKERDLDVARLLREHGADLKHYKDHVLFEADEVMTQQGKPYTVFTPYKKRWLAQANQTTYAHHPSEDHLRTLLKVQEPLPMPGLQEMGFEFFEPNIPPKSVDEELIRHYEEQRDYPAAQHTSRLGVHLRFGTLSIRRLADHTRTLSKAFQNELIWRDFYAQILHHYPHVVDHSFRPEYDAIPWRNNEAEFQRWCEGTTGYPMVDAGMRQLNEIGYMHNRVRMITASFLTKHLLVDWRWGEAYFGEKLLDYELASNNGGWQWAAGSGTDAAPYFRIFNPATQAERFDPQGRYQQHWLPELGTSKYPQPMVAHKAARQRCLDTYKHALEAARS